MQNQSSVSWKCPSNIALIKYWGKYGIQIPQNPSISFTLNNAHTITQVEYEYTEKKLENLDLEFYFESKRNEIFESKIRQFLSSIHDIYPLILHLRLRIDSKNSFPHSSGIASSASSMAALAMCLVDIEKEIFEKENIDLGKASDLARLGSGSACRSIFPKIALWGKTKGIPLSSNEHAIPFTKDIDPVFLDFRDDILIVSNKEKSVSSRAGHALMDNNPYAKARYAEANKNLLQIIKSMKEGDLYSFGNIIEKEALTLHALMMSSEPPYILMEAETLQIIKLIQEFRKSKDVPVYFSLDAGPNIHMLYPKDYVDEISILKTDLISHCYNGKIIEDEIGNGPEKL